jgi:hypothetical protein
MGGYMYATLPASLQHHINSAWPAPKAAAMGSLRVLTVSTEAFCAWKEWLDSSSRAVLTLPLSQTNFTSLATPNQVGSGKTALVTLLHEGGHAAHFSNILQVCAAVVCVGVLDGWVDGWILHKGPARHNAQSIAQSIGFGCLEGGVRYGILQVHA